MPDFYDPSYDDATEAPVYPQTSGSPNPAQNPSASASDYGAIDYSNLNLGALNDVFGGLSGMLPDSSVSSNNTVDKFGFGIKTPQQTEGSQFANVSPEEQQMIALLEAAKQGGLENTQKANEQWAKENPELAAAVDPLAKANKEASDKQIAEEKESEPVRRQLSQYLQNNQFDKAFKYAQANDGMKFLMDPNALQNLRKPFTNEEMSAFMQAIPSDYKGKDFVFDPTKGAEYSTSKNNPVRGYPNANAAFQTAPDKTVEAIKNVAMVAGAGLLTAGLAPTLFGAIGAGSSLSAVEAAAVKSMVGNALVTAVRGGDIGDVLKSAITAGATAGLSAIATPAIFNAFTAAGLSPDVAKAATTAAVSAGMAKARGEDPLKAGLVSGFGAIANLQGANLADKFAQQFNIPPEIAKQLMGPAGSAIATKIAGGDVLLAAANQFVNQNADAWSKYAKDKFIDLFPDSADKIQDWTREFNNFLRERKDDFEKFVGFAKDNDTSPTGGLPPKGGSGEDKNGDGVVVTGGNGQPTGGTTNFPVNLGPTGGLPPKGNDDDGVVVTGSNDKPTDDKPLNPPVDLGPTGGLPPKGNDDDGVVVTGSNDKPTDDKPLNPPVDLGPTGGLPPKGNDDDGVVVTGSNDKPTGDNPLTPPVDLGPTGGLDQVKVEAKKDQPPPDDKPLEPPLDFIKTGNYPKFGPDGIEQVTVESTKTKPPLDPLHLNPFKPTTCCKTPDFNKPIDITVKRPSTSGTMADMSSGASANPFSWLDTSDQMLKGKPNTAQAAKLAELKQIFNQLDPSLQGVLADRGYGAAPARSGGLIQAYADGGSTCCFKAILKDLAPNFAPCTQEMLPPLSARKATPFTLAKLAQLKPYIAPTGGMGGMAKGGLPSKYAEAAPEGHNPEFITGLTGYYAQGGGTGQSDDIPAMLHDGDYVMDADTVAAFGDGSSKAGAEVLEHLREQVPHRDGVQGKAVPAKIADGEYVFPASFVTALGGGDNKRGSKMLDEMRERLRAHKRSAPTSKIPPKAKSPLDYLRKG